MYIPNSKRIQFPYNGPTSSADLNDLSDSLTSDIGGLANALNANELDLNEFKKVSFDQIRYLLRKVSELEASNTARNYINGYNNLRLVHHQTAYDTSNLKLFSNVQYAPRVDTTYGVITLPSNLIEPKFYANHITDGQTIVPLSLNTAVSSVFIDEGGSTPVDHEAGNIKVSSGDPTRAFNGINTSYWVRTVEFDGASDVTEVQCEIIVTVPRQNNTVSNTLVVHPYPIGGVDIVDVSYSPDLTSAFIKIPHSEVPYLLSPKNNAREMFFTFPPTDIDQIRIRLRQRNFIEEDGKKVFRYGLQEVGLYLIDYEKGTADLSGSAWTAQNDSSNIACVYKIDAPAGFFFTAINHFTSSPNFALEDASNRHLFFKIYSSDPTLGSATELWNSSKTVPQNQSTSVGSQISLSGNIRTIYVMSAMRYVRTSGGVNSPFRANSAPYLKSFTLEYSVASAI